MKYINFRFDVDTHKCIEKGVPNLINLGTKHNVRFTFFVNFGRAVNQSNFIRKIFISYFSSNDGSLRHYHNLSAFQKLGLKDYFVAAVLNPYVGAIGKNVIKQAAMLGHEIGLHGGSNHDEWNTNIFGWTEERIQKELNWGIAQMKKISPTYRMSGFAAPHWKANKKVYAELEAKGFKYTSDIHTRKALQTINKSYDLLPNIPVNISGEPGGVGYLEWCRAKGFDDNKILKDFENMLSKRNKFATVYDHPYYSGVSEIPLLEKMIIMAKKKNYKIVTLVDILKYS